MNGLRQIGAKARRIRRPSERNFQVFEQVRLLGQSQTAVAARYGVTQERVSQICLQVDRWWARSQAAEGTADRLRADRMLARRRFEQIFALAARELAKENVDLVTEKTWVEGGQTRRSETIRTQEPTNPQWGKIVLGISKQLAQLDAQLGPDDAHAPAPVLHGQQAAEALKSSTSCCADGETTVSEPELRRSSKGASEKLPTPCVETRETSGGADYTHTHRKIRECESLLPERRILGGG